MNRVQIIITIFCILIAIAGLFLFAFTGRQTNTIQTVSGGTLKVWGTEKTAIFTDIFKKYQQQTQIKIDYTEINKKIFDDQILEALASGRAPDAIIADTDWIAENKDKLALYPATTKTVADFKNTYVDVIGANLISEKTDQKTKVVTQYFTAMPLWLDPLVLFWNKDIFNAESIALPPVNWEEFSTISNKIKNTDTTGNVLRAGSAMGRAKNIPQFKGILSLLMLQQGVSPKNTFFQTTDYNDKEKTQSAIRFYTDFANPGFSGYTWNAALSNPQDIFASGKLGMMLDYMSSSDTLTTKNPHLSFNIAKAPQPKDSEVPIYTGNIIGVAVPRISKNVTPGWTFAFWLANTSQAKSITINRPVAPVRRDLLRDSQIANTPLFPIIKEETLNARRISDPYPIESSSIIENMIEAIDDKQMTITEGITDAAKRINRVLEENIK